ncbi:MAG: hypothetical protein FWG83_04175 [Oscillospiraceae bacterium]|nr:hypothetical protein [Oscillospiraceae bacterium]
MDERNPNLSNFCSSANAPELAATINTLASLLAKGKTVEEIELLALQFEILTHTLFKIAHIQRKQEHLERLCREKREEELKRGNLS